MWLTAFCSGLIRRVPAVCLFIAHFLHADTLPCFTLEHGGPFTCFHCTEGEESTLQSKHRRKENRRCVKIRVTYAAAKLVAEVSAVMHPVTLESASNAGAVQTLELIRSASRTTCNSKRSRSKPRYGKKLVRRQEIGTEMISWESMLTGLSVCWQHPTHLFGSVSSDIGFIKNFSSAVVYSPPQGARAEHPSSWASEYLVIWQILFLSGTIGSALIFPANMKTRAVALKNCPQTFWDGPRVSLRSAQIWNKFNTGNWFAKKTQKNKKGRGIKQKER